MKLEEADRSLSVVRPSPLAEAAYIAILDRITNLEIAPGARITVDNLARELGVSPTPVREALGRLEAEGLVLRTHLIGHRASPQLSRSEIEQLFELRLLIEPAAAAMAAARLSMGELERLRQLHDAMANLRDKPYHAYGEFARKDAEFHALIAAGSKNAFLEEALSKLHIHVRIFRRVANSQIANDAISEHAELLSAIMNQDSARSEIEMKSHILASRTRILKILPEIE